MNDYWMYLMYKNDGGRRTYCVWRRGKSEWASLAGANHMTTTHRAPKRINSLRAIARRLNGGKS